MPRELWKGAVRFGLVHIPVSLYPAEQSEELSFTMLDRLDLQPVGYKRYNKSTGDEVAYEDIVKGYEYEEGRYVTLEKDDFKRANVEASQTVDIVGFVGPARDLAVPRDLKDAKVQPNEVKMAERLIGDMTMKWDPAAYHDTYRDDLLKMIEEKAERGGKAAPKSKRAPREAEVIDFATLLERSLAARKHAGAAANDEDAAPRRAGAPRRRAPAAKVRRKAAGARAGTSHRRAA